MPINFSTLSEGLVRNFGEAPCLVHVERQRRYTFREFHVLGNRIVNMMRTRLGLQRGDVWLTILHNDNLSLLGPLTALKGDSCACYGHASDALPQQARQIALVNSRVVFIEAELLPTHYALLSELNQTIVSMDPVPTGFPDVLHFWDLLEGASEANPDITHDAGQDILSLRMACESCATDAVLQYSAQTWMAGTALHSAMPGSASAAPERFLHLGPFARDSLALWCLPVMFRGGCQVTLNAQELAPWCQVLAQERITGSYLPLSVLRHLLQLGEAKRRDWPALGAVYYSESRGRTDGLAELLQRFGPLFVKVLASAEHCAPIACLAAPDHLERYGQPARLTSAGRVLAGIEALVVGPDAQPLPAGQIGELWLRSHAVAAGCLQAATTQAPSFEAGFWKSGCYARLDAAGYLYLLDRMNNTLECNGQRVYPAQVEAALCSHPQVAQALVRGAPGEDAITELVAEVVLHKGASLAAEALQAHLAERLAPHERPTRITLVAGLAAAAHRGTLLGNTR